MKALIFLLLTGLLFFSCKPKSNPDQLSTSIINNPASAEGMGDTTNFPRIQLVETNFDFGVIIQGEKVSHIFKFKNIGHSDLIVRNATASCGCTVPKFSSEPIKPGEEGQIEVVFNSENRQGRQMKTVYIWANTMPNKTEIVFTAEVVIPEKKE